MALIIEEHLARKHVDVDSNHDDPEVLGTFAESFQQPVVADAP